MTNAAGQTKDYDRLVEQIQNALSGLERSLKQITVETYWDIGKRIAEYLIEGKQRAAYGQRLYENLARQLPVSAKTLERSVAFYRAFPISTNLSKLKWSHFVALLAVKDERTRKSLCNRAIKGQWTYLQLREKILPLQHSRRSPVATGTAVRLDVPRLRLRTCKVIRTEKEAPAGLMIDCGFAVRWPLSESARIGIKTGDIVEIEWQKASFKAVKVTALEQELFTFSATIQRVIDGDTLLALIDSGFGFFIEQRLRLRGLDCPERKTGPGLKAKQFVERALKKSPRVVIKSYKPEKYDRYLVDVFFLPGEKDPQKIAASGRFLNQELLDEGLAAPV